ncbi:MAG: DUF2878 domain-containing protein [Gammaproteobacteria bacterium]|nr:DUF2878 domain-containing protein [Gammaproteobacteria bacterium]
MAISTTLKNISLNKTINFVLFQGIWFACVLGAANGTMISAFILFAALIYWQLCPSNRSLADIIFTLILLPTGLLIDSLWAWFQVVEYKESLPFNFLAPYWIGILWITFALSLNSSMKWVFDHPKLAIAFGALGGPLSYLAAERLGAIQIHNTKLALPLLALSWGLVMGIILITSHLLSRNKPINKAGPYHA